MRVVSFFSGIGGFDLGFERAGMRVVFQCEKNTFCQKVLRKHWPDVPLYEDINGLEADEIPDAELWCGGFPCQDLSLANQGKRKGLNGDRSGLFYTFADLLQAKRKTGTQPRWVVLENVLGLLNSHRGEDFKILLQTLDELGYGISWRVLDAKYFGTPQRRRRVFIVGSFGGISSAKVLFDERPGVLSNKARNGSWQHPPVQLPPKFATSDLYVIQHASIGRKHTAGPQAKGYRNDGEAYTLDSRGGADAACTTTDAFRVRAATGVSTGLDGRRYRALGNAVAVPVVEWVGQRILEVDAKAYCTDGFHVLGEPLLEYLAETP